jgi:hypothetical protein
MHRSLTANPVAQRLAAAVAVLVTVLACAVALPTQSHAATTAWSSAMPPAQYCYDDPRGWQTITTPHGWVQIRECLKVARSASGTAYYNGVLAVQYHSKNPFVGDVMGGKSMLALAGKAYVNDCPRVLWTSTVTRYCYSPTRVRPTGYSIYGKGILIKSTGGWFSPLVWSPVVNPDRPG